jgi:heme-degrading monooxygenase HmoA
MHRFAAAIEGMPGLVSVHTLSDTSSDRLVGLAIFETEEDFVRLAPLARATVADDPFDVWEQREIDGFRLVEV